MMRYLFKTGWKISFLGSIFIAFGTLAFAEDVSSVPTHTENQEQIQRKVLLTQVAS